MTEAGGFTLSYLEEYPEEAARVLETLGIEDAASLLASVPARLGAPVLARVLPPRAALFLDSLPDKSALALLGRLGGRNGVSIIRYLSEKKRSTLIAGLPARRAVVYRLLLGYPEETVGARVDSDVLILSPRKSAREALDRFRRSSRELDPRMYVVGEGRRLMGYISLQRLLNAPADSRLEQLMETPSWTLPAPALIRSVADNEGWKYLNAIPVVEKGSRFIGVLHHSTMLNTIIRRPPGFPGPGLESAVAAAGSMYWQLVSSLIKLVVDMLPANTGNSEKGD